MSDGPRPDLSIVILCYRSEERLLPYVQQTERDLREGGVTNYELVLVGNYVPDKTDRTPEVIRRLAQENPHVVPVTLEKRGMLGWDVMTGFGRATGEAIALIDGDGQMPPRDIVRLYRVLKSGEFDFVKTYRTKRLDGAHRRLTSWCFNAMFHLLFPGTHFRDMNSKPKMFTRAALDRLDLTCQGWFSDGQIMLEVRRLDLSYAEIPTVFPKNEWRASFVSAWTVLEMIGYMLLYRVQYWFKRRPGRS
jgi:glycosyltransferase involved in cell wall biosynthesis